MAECQICCRDIKAPNGSIAHHGFERDGSGYQTPSCPGARQPPFSESRDAIPREIERLERYVEGARNLLGSVQRGEVPVPRPGGGGEIEPGCAIYERRAQEYARRIASEISSIERETQRLQQRYDGWLPPVQDLGRGMSVI